MRPLTPTAGEKKKKLMDSEHKEENVSLLESSLEKFGSWRADEQPDFGTKRKHKYPQALVKPAWQKDTVGTGVKSPELDSS